MLLLRQYATPVQVVVMMLIATWLRILLATIKLMLRADLAG